MYNKVTGIAHNNIKKINNYRFPKEFIYCLNAVYLQNIKMNKQYQKHIKYVADILNKSGVKYALLKGAYLINHIYELGERVANDIDILIQFKDISNCQNILLENGFIQGKFDQIQGIVPAPRKESSIIK